MQQRICFRTTILVVTYGWIVKLASVTEGSKYVEQSPENVTTFLGRIAMFHCLSHGDSYVFWFANGSDTFYLSDDHNTSSVSVHRDDGERGENSTLSVMASQLNNFTSYTCGVLDLSTNQIVNYSSPALLLVQGRPLPPSTVIVYLEDAIDNDESEIIFVLIWSRSSTLFDLTYDNRSRVSIIYTVYGYYNDTEILYDESDLFYRNTTSDLAHTAHFNAHNCRLKSALFSVSAEFEEVGEGAMSEPEKGVDNSDTKICSSNKQNNDHTLTAVLVGAIVNPLVLIVLITSITTFLVIILQYRKKRLHCTANNIDMKINGAYEFRNNKFAKKEPVQCHPNSAYDSLTHV